MAKVLFFEKPGCAGNARQKALLVESGHEVEARSLLATPWTADELRRYFGSLPVRDWFNRSARRVKSGEIDPDAMQPEAALALISDDPRLIRRPLIKVGDRREVGFDRDVIAAWIGLRPGGRPVTEDCVRAREGKAHSLCRRPDEAADSRAAAEEEGAAP